MKQMKVMSIIFLIAFTLSGCSAKLGTKSSEGNLKGVHSVKTVAVSTLKCSDPEIAQEIRNKIVESLLSQYTVVIGDNADVLIMGAVTLTNNIVSEVKADIVRDKDVHTIVSVAQSDAQNSPEVMGKKMGEKILGILSKE